MESIFLKAIRLKELGFSDEEIFQNLRTTIDIWGRFPSTKQITDAIEVSNKPLEPTRETGRLS